MSLSPFYEPPRWHGWLGRTAGVVSVGIHVVLALIIVSREAPELIEDTWVEVAISQPKPPPPPPPPEPPKAKEPPKPKAPVKFQDIPKTPPPEAPPVAEPQKAAPRRLGVTLNSVATGANTGLSVRSGNTTATRQDNTKVDPGAGFDTRPYSQVLEQPKVLEWPPMVVTKEAIDAEIEGTIRVLVDLSADGRPTRVKVVSGLGYGLDESCVAAWMKSRWKPAKDNGSAVAVTGIPRDCRVKKEQ